MGKAVSQFSTPWTGYPAGNQTSFLIGGQDDVTGINQLAYTASFGNGVSGSVSLEDQSAYDQSQLLGITAGNGTATTWLAGTGTGTSYYGGVASPDIVGQLRVDQAWGLFQASVAAHDIHASYYLPTLETSGHPSDVWGFAGMLALSIKNIPTGPGDTINMDATYANGASRYVIGGVSPNNFSMFSSSGLAGVYQSVGFGTSADGIIGPTGDIENTTAWGFRGGYTHNWSPTWSSSVFGSYTGFSWGSSGRNLICNGLGAQNIVFSNGLAGCNPDFNIAQAGFITRWTPVKNLTFSGEIMWTGLDQKNSGLISSRDIAPNNNLVGATKPAGVTYELRDQNTITFGVRAQRVF
jgi:hypothetical protein